MKFKSKRDLIAAIEQEHHTFLELAATIPQKRYTEPGVWGDDWSIKDLFIHLTEWEKLFLGWYRAGVAGEPVELPAPGYKWNETPRLNRHIQQRTARRTWRTARTKFDASYEETLGVIRKIPEAKLLTPGAYAWTKKTTLAAYAAANTSSHYRTATKILKRWLRTQA